MSFYEYTRYRDVIVSEISRNTHVRGYRAKLSKAAGFHAAYLPQILSGSSNLTPDQGSLLCEFWEYDERMSEFFLTLLHYERATTESLKKRLQRKLLEIRTPLEQFKSLNVQEIQADLKDAQIYFSSCEYAAVLSCLDIPHINNEEQISDFLKLHVDKVKLVLSKLEEMQLVKRLDGAWSQTNSDHVVLQNNRYLTQSFLNSVNFRFGQSFTMDYQSKAWVAVLPMSNAKYSSIRSRLGELVKEACDDEGKPAEIIAGLSLSLFRF